MNVLPEEMRETEVSKHPLASAGTLWVSVARKTGFRRLHRSGGCWYTAALVEYPEDEASAQFDKRCERCWGPQPAVTDTGKGQIESDVSVSSEDESSSED